VDGDLQLELLQTVPCDLDKGYVPQYRFAMVNTKTRANMGLLSLRVGLIKKMSEYGGHIGYGVDPAYRGHRYAARSCKLLLPLIRKLGINPLVLTCDPANAASVKTIEALGATLIATKKVEIEPSQMRMTSIYHLRFEEDTG
jgi:tagatose 1,6-diphosphate aldolase